MPKAAHTHTIGCVVAPSRRQLVGGSILAALSGAAFAGAVVLPNPGEASPVENPDAELLAACAEFDALEAAYLATGFSHAAGSLEEAAADAEQGRIGTAQLPLVDRIVAHRALTPAGQVARARSLLAWRPDLAHEKFAGDVSELLVFAVLRDLVGGAAA